MRMMTQNAGQDRMPGMDWKRSLRGSAEGVDNWAVIRGGRSKNGKFMKQKPKINSVTSNKYGLRWVKTNSKQEGSDTRGGEEG